MNSFRLTATNINTAEDLNFIQFAVKRHPKNRSLCKKAKKGGGGEGVSKIERWKERECKGVKLYCKSREQNKV